jgi:site-specific DNA-cytosine methylase
MPIKADKSLRAYYNEIEPATAQWLRNLMAEGWITKGDVDERSIEDVQPNDIAGYDRLHFFAGVAVWDYALNQAGWGRGEIWTGSCPCQPFSSAGKGKGFTDERHLWPAFHHLISQCRPPIVFGEQVASKDGLGWLDLVHADLEGTGYAVGAVDSCAAGFGAPHIRQRLYFAGERLDDAAGARFIAEGPGPEGEARDEAWLRGPERGCATGGLANHHGCGCLPWGEGSAAMGHRQAAGAGCGAGGLDDAKRFGWGERRNNDTEHDGKQLNAARNADRPSPTNGLWADADWLFCRDGKWRPVEPGYEQMVDGSASSLGRVCASDIEKIEGEINAWSIRHQADAGEALRGVWGELSAKAICEREAGRFSGVRSPSVLLAFMRQLTVQGWRFADAMACSRTRASEIVLRVMRFDAEAARTPLQRELAGQLHGESSNPLRELSSLLAHHAETCWADACREKAGAASFPLAHGTAARVMRLRGYGNSINAVQAQAFVEAFMESHSTNTPQATRKELIL